jgi:hypothetical protein
MTPTRETRLRWQTGPGDMSRGEADNPQNKPSNHHLQAANKLRLQYLVTRLHDLGPKPLFHFLDEVERGADPRSHLERYAALPADFIKAHAGDRFAPSLHCIDWGEP